MLRLSRPIKTTLVLALAVLAGCSPIQPFYLHEDGDLSHYLEKATAIETPDVKDCHLAEVEQAGVFGLAGFEEQVLDAMLGIQCPNILYPYAAASIGQLVTSGGFPPFPMQPINFEGLYGETLRQRMEQAQAQGDNVLANAETAGNA